VVGVVPQRVKLVTGGDPLLNSQALAGVEPGIRVANLRGEKGGGGGEKGVRG
jgi:hypothetical protein